MLDNKIPIAEPEEVLNSKREWVGNNADPLNKVLSEIEITNNKEDYVLSSDIKDILAQLKLDITITKFGSLMKKYCAIKKLNNVTNGD